MLLLTGEPIALADQVAVANGAIQVGLSDASRTQMLASRATVEQALTDRRVVYGINTGFGKLSDIQIPDGQVAQLQTNLVRSHACGFGEPLSRAETRLLILLRANVLAKGFSGARPLISDLLVELLNRDVWPRVPSRGSVGASGDLAPLAHLALALIGEGKARVGEGDWQPAAAALAAIGLQPVALEAKEGLALLNGTQAIGAVGAVSLAQAQRLVEWSTIAGAMTLEAMLGTPAAFDERIHRTRPHPGQLAVAEQLLRLLEGSEIRESHRFDDHRVQDAYSLRCMPQVHGPALDTLTQLQVTLEIESGSATDNPLVFADHDEFLSGGNFHGAPLALGLDQATIALTMLLSICERRIDRLMNPDLSDGLPPFLAHDPGIESGFMIAHVAAVAALNEARVLSHPACVDNCTTSAGKEDHVSMGMTSALKFRQVVHLGAHLVATELVAAAQGLDFRKPLRPGLGVERAYEWVRRHVSAIKRDEPLGEPIERLAAELLRGFSVPTV